MEPTSTSTSLSQAEKRAKLRRAKILANSEDRMNRIFGVQNSSTITNKSDINEDNDNVLPALSSSNILDDHHRSENSSSNQFEQLSSLTINTKTMIQNPQQQSIIHHHLQKNTMLPSRDESFPHKVSLISSPIHYKTLQQSQRFQQQQNSFLSLIILWILMYIINLKLLLLLIFSLGSYYNVNYVMLFITFESIHFVSLYLFSNNHINTSTNNNNNNDNNNTNNNINNNNINNNSSSKLLNNRILFIQFYEDFLLSIFCYIIIQATLLIIKR